MNSQKAKRWGLACGEWAGKPNSVAACLHAAGDHLSGTPIARRLLRPTRGPERAAPVPVARDASCLVLLPMGFAWPARSPGPPVVSCATVSPSLTLAASRQRLAISSLLHCAVGSPRLDVIQHRALGSSDFPRTPRWVPAIAWPTRLHDDTINRLAHQVYTLHVAGNDHERRVPLTNL